MDYEIDAICNHFYGPFGRYYLVKFKHHGPEWNLWTHECDISHEALDKYCARAKLPRVKLVESGAASQQEQGTPNMVSADRVVHLINSKRTMYAYRDDAIQVQQWIGQPVDVAAKNILVLLYESHYYVIATCRGSVYVADGTNDCKTNAPLLAKIRRSLRLCNNKPLITLTYLFQQYADHCGASAALIGLELIRQLKGPTGCIDEDAQVRTIEPPPALRRQFVERLHKYPSEYEPAMDEQGNVLQLTEIMRKRCQYCQRFYPKRQHLLMHERKCSQQQQQ